MCILLPMKLTEADAVFPVGKDENLSSDSISKRCDTVTVEVLFSGSSDKFVLGFVDRVNA